MKTRQVGCVMSFIRFPMNEMSHLEYRKMISSLYDKNKDTVCSFNIFKLEDEYFLIESLTMDNDRFWYKSDGMFGLNEFYKHTLNN